MLSRVSTIHRRSFLALAGLGCLGLIAHSKLADAEVTKPPRVSSMPTVDEGAVVEFADFTQFPTAGLALGNRSLTAAGATYEMTPHSSTKAGVIAALPQGSTNPYRLLAVGGNGAASSTPDLDVSGFTLNGTDQGHSYGGVRIGYSKAAKLHDFFVTGIPGNAAGPPGETFSVAAWHADDLVIERVAVDGRDDGGRPVAATLFGLNDCARTVVRDCEGHHAAYGMGIAVWQCTDTTLEDLDLRSCRHPVNFEQHRGGYIRLTRLDLRDQLDGGPHVTVNSNLASSQVVITDPKVDSWPLRVGVSFAPYFGLPQVQRVSDVQLIVAGKDVTHDPFYLRCGQVWAG